MTDEIPCVHPRIAARRLLVATREVEYERTNIAKQLRLLGISAQSAFVQSGLPAFSAVSDFAFLVLSELDRIDPLSEEGEAHRDFIVEKLRQLDRSLQEMVTICRQIASERTKLQIK
jgi:hypothetical protein